MNVSATERTLWKWRETDPDRAGRLAAELSIDPMTARLLLSRGVDSPEAARRFLSLTPDVLPDPFLLGDMERAVSRILSAMERKEKIVFYGDYDVDGVTGTAIYLEIFKALGVPADCYIPHRKEGYGLHGAALNAIRAAGAGLVITSDCGSCSGPEIAEASRLGLDLIVTDHHLLEGAAPPAMAFLNPHAPGPVPYPFLGLCSAGVAFKLGQALFRARGISVDRLAPLLDLVALGTVADVAPLIEENRYFVKKGLSLIREGRRVGIRALLQVAQIDPASVTERTVGYHLAPRLNAAGRLYHAREALLLLTTDSREEALRLAERLDRYNSERREIEAKMFEEADRQALETGALERDAAVVASSEWRPGVVGIIAARLAGRYHRPAIVIALAEDGLGRGSGRSIPGLDLHRMISRAVTDYGALLEGFGGHAAALGVTIRHDQIDPFRAALGRAFSECPPIDRARTLWIDLEVSLEGVSFPWIREVAALAPFGQANPAPVLSVSCVKMISFRRGADRSVRFKIRKEGGLTFDVWGSEGQADFDLFSEGMSIDVAFTPFILPWQGEARIIFGLKGVRESEHSP